MTSKSSRALILLAACAFSGPVATGFAAPSTGWDSGPGAMDRLRDALPRVSFSAPGRRAGAAGGLVINATEIGVGKFHRYDDSIHPYPQGSVWRGHISPGGEFQTPLVLEGADGSTGIQFSNLEELLRAIVSVSSRSGAKVSVLNVHGHGLPGGMWFPRDREQEMDSECGQWRESAEGPDRDNYEAYYSPLDKGEIMMIRSMSESPGHYACTTGASDWRKVAVRVPGLRGAFAADAVIHFQSCVVGLGDAGRRFAEEVGGLLLDGENASVQTSVDFGLGDWSMPEGMGFWDYQDDRQLARDNRVYSADRRDREIMQAGTIRVARRSGGEWTTSLIGGQNFMSAVRGPAPASGQAGISARGDEGSRRGFAVPSQESRQGILGPLTHFPSARARLTLRVPVPPAGSIRVPGTRFCTSRIE